LPLLNDTIAIENGTDILTAKLGNFSLDYQDRTLTATDGTYTEVFDCDVCTTIADRVNATREEIIADTDPMFDEMETLRTTLRNDLVTSKGLITYVCLEVDKYVAAFEALLDGVTVIYETEVKPEVVKYNSLRTVLFSLFFAFPLLPIILTFSTMLTKKTIFLTIQNGLTWLACSLLLILLGAHLMLTVVLSDYCEANDLMLKPKGFTKLGMDKNVAGVIQACFDYDIPLIYVFGVNDQLDFAVHINLNFGFNSTAAFDLSALDELKEIVANTTVSTFDGRGDAALQDCNDLIAVADVTSPLLTRDNIASASATTYYTSAGTGRNNLQTAISEAQTTLDLETSATSDFMDIVSDMQDDMDDITAYTEDLKNDTEHIQQRFEGIQLEIAPILMASGKLLQTNCGFIGNTYRSLDENICMKLAPSIAAMCLSMILVVLSLMPVCCIGLYLKGNLQKREDRSKSIAQIEPATDSQTTGLAML